RPTGGRAVLHDAELTYAIIEPCDGRESVMASYCRLSQVIAAAIRRLALPIDLAPGKETGGPSRHERPVDCFAVSTAADLVALGRKIAGSAQLRRQGALLQHGSIKLAPSCLGLFAPAPVTLAELLGVADPGTAWLSRMQDQLARAIAAEFGVPWEPARLADSELRRAVALEGVIAERSAS
ncbi:MAG: hypothetical protein KGR26_09360, partial [Cyanobacteria bacterium REEB65]|nr:hypothetical protein [Cyanobacteria bacterium REEB65]